MGLLINLCTPALIYLVFSLTQIAIDVFKYENNRAFFKAIVMVIFTTLLNILCSRGLGIISLIIVFVPFMLMSFITTILLVVFGLDPATGKMKHQPINKENPRHNVEDHRHRQHRNRKKYDTDFSPLSPPIDTSTSDGKIKHHPINKEKPRHNVEDHRHRQHRNRKKYDTDFSPLLPPTDTSTSDGEGSPESPPPPMTTSTEVFGGRLMF